MYVSLTNMIVMHVKLYNEPNTTRSVIGHYLWSIRVQTQSWCYRKIVFFVLSNMANSFENVCKIIPDWASKRLKKKNLVGAVYEQEKQETEEKSVPGDVKNT